MQLTEFKINSVAEFGPQILNTILLQDSEKEKLDAAVHQSEQREQFIDFNLTKMALALHQKFSDDKDSPTDLFKVYSEQRQEASALYRNILVHTGVLEKKVEEVSPDNFRATYSFKDPKLSDKFYFTSELKTQDEEEYKRRRSRRNALNLRLNRACKAALALHEAGAKPSDMQIKENAKTKIVEASIKTGPKEIFGATNEPIVISSGSKQPLDGASVSPTITGLASVSDNAHKTATKNSTEQANKKTESQKDIDALLNTALMTIRKLADANSATDAQKSVIKNILTEAQRCVN